MSKSKNFLIEPADDDIRLDRWFKRHVPDLTNGQVQKLIRTGQIRIDGQRASASQHIKAGQELRLPPLAAGMTESHSDENAYKPSFTHKKNDIRKMTIFEDDYVLVLNKPHGLAVQGGTGIKKSIDDMLEALTDAKQGKPKLVHRLDRDTSGILVIAKNIQSAMSLTKAFRQKNTEKTYWGITIGVPGISEGIIDAPLAKTGEKSMISDSEPNAKNAVTQYRIIDKAKKLAAFVEMQPLTGRTHQLRVHMASLGTPLLGDRLYAPHEHALSALKDSIPTGTLHLHARKIIIPHPHKGLIDVTAPLSSDMAKTFKWFGF
ncbi:MAG: RluA family pseudouridine synthase [Alphaproteobacteria bacterium]|nr:RluA family pseudouridine synthase [Alphaproteobacteria bacterium]MCL2505092.1 RluA family pseudouridine synthase [Alphaproteobacteria bacterium]